MVNDLPILLSLLMAAMDDETIYKKRRLQRACDFCRRKKIRCDGEVTSDNEPAKCSNCKLYNSSCTYVQTAQRRVSSIGSNGKGMPSESLEDRVRRMDNLLNNLVGDTSKVPHQISPTIPGPSSSTSCNRSPPYTAATSHYMASLTEAKVDADEAEDYMTLTDNFQRLDVETNVWSRFFGKSSSAQLVQTAIDLKNGLVDDKSARFPHEDAPIRTPDHGVFTALRPEFNKKPRWEAEFDDISDLPTYIFPEDDLLAGLLDIYFAKHNVMFPLLHRPTFEKLVASNLHLSHHMFGAVLLLVCATAARFSQDSRVLLDDDHSRRSAGWKYFVQVQMVRRSLLAPPTIYDLQYYALYAHYVFGTSAPQSCWSVIGMGIRLAQDVGAHRKKKKSGPTDEDELWKRAFWGLVTLDRDASLALGRPCAIQDDDIDVEFPIECDDEYWDHPDADKRFKQPAGKPSTISFFIASLRLNRIVSMCLRTLYSPMKSKLQSVDDHWEQNVVTELDSTMNQWVDSVPDHLRWDPHREDELYFNQSVILFATYYNLQILIHKSFIPSPRNTSPLTFPSLAICTNAARSVSRLVGIQRQRGFGWAQLYIVLPSFTAAVVLLLNILGGKRTRVNVNSVREMQDVHNCMQVLRDAEQFFHFAGRFWDILYQLASVGDLPLPEPASPQGYKRRRDSDVPIDAYEVLTPSNSVNHERDLRASRSGTTGPSLTNGDTTGELASAPSAPCDLRDGLLSTAHLNSAPTNDILITDKSLTRDSGENQHIFNAPLPMNSSDLGSLPVHQADSSHSINDMLPISQDMPTCNGLAMNPGPFPFGTGVPLPPVVESYQGLDDVTLAIWTSTLGGFDSLEDSDWSAFLTGASSRSGASDQA